MNSRGTNQSRSLEVLCEARRSIPKRKARQEAKKGRFVTMGKSVCWRMTRTNTPVIEVKARRVDLPALYIGRDSLENEGER